MEVRQSINSEHAKTLDTAGLRKQFLVEDVFERDALRLAYSHIDRIIVGGVWPATRAYTFIWGMVGENQVFSDMDHIAVRDLR